MLEMYTPLAVHFVMQLSKVFKWISWSVLLFSTDMQMGTEKLNSLMVIELTWSSSRSDLNSLYPLSIHLEGQWLGSIGLFNFNVID